MKSERWRFLTELIPLTLFLMGLDSFVFDGRLFGYEPSPLWVLILLIAPRHGSMAGLIAGIAAASIFLWNMSAHGYFWQDLLHRHPASLIMPALLLLVGVFLGALRESLTMQVVFFKNKVQNLAAQLDISEVKRTQLERDRIEMEKRIAGQSNTLLALHESFKRLGSANSEEKLFLLLDIVLRAETKAESCGIWRIVDGQAQFLAGSIYKEIPPLGLWVSKKRSVATPATWSQLNKDAPGADIAGLIFDNTKERLVVALAGVPFVRMTRDMVLHFGLLAERAGIILEGLRHLETLRREAVQDTELGLMSEAYLRRRVDEEISLARRHNTPLSLMACAITAAPQTMHAHIESVLSCSILTCIRLSDGLAYFSDRKAFVIVLPQCDAQGTEVVLKKIESNLRMLDLQNDHGEALYHIVWNVYISDGKLKDDILYEYLFLGMRIRQEDIQ